MSSLMPDEAWEALVDLDVNSLEPGANYYWSEEERRWRPSGV